MPPLLYKGAIRDLRGDDLLPLSMIRSRYPVLYHREAAKYAERPHVMDHPVHQLDCRWTDVVFFSPVHPAPIFDALRESGRVLGGLGYWTIAAEQLAPERTCILLKRGSRRNPIVEIRHISDRLTRRVSDSPDRPAYVSGIRPVSPMGGMLTSPCAGIRAKPPAATLER